MGERQGVAVVVTLGGSGERAGHGGLVVPPPPPCSDSVEEVEEWRERWWGEVASRVLEGDTHREMGDGDLTLLPCGWLCPGLPVVLRERETDGAEEAEEEKETSSGKTLGWAPGLDDPGDPEAWGSLWMMVWGVEGRVYHGGIP